MSSATRHRHSAKRAGRPPLVDLSTQRESWLRTTVGGDRPYVLAFFVLVAVLAMMVVRPLQSYTAAEERVNDLEVAKADLEQRVADLQIRESRLRDPEEIELLARRRLGLVKPGEIPYVVSDGDPDTDQVRPDGRTPGPVRSVSTLERLGQAFASLFRR